MTGSPSRQAAGELRWASVLFVDLADYTALTYSWDALDLRDMLSGYFELARSIVGRYGGEVEKFIGDAIVAVWGANATREDDAERCVIAGLEVLASVARFGEQHGLPDLIARGGVVTGRVALLNRADEGLVAGDSVNLASRIQSVAPPGSMLVDDVTMRVTRATIAYTSAGEHQLKGMPRPMRLWTAHGVVEPDQDPQQQGEWETPFLGRDRELTGLRSLFESALTNRRARLVAVSGQAGVGKSRLASEFEAHVADAFPDVAWHRGRCISYGEGVAFWALREMLRQRLGLRTDDTGKAARAKLAERLKQWVPDEKERGFVEPRLGVLIDVSDRDFIRQELFAAWRLFLERVSTAQPVVLLIEDLQWADAGLLDFLGYLLDWSAERPLFFLTLNRAQDVTESGTLTGDHHNGSSLHLEPLSTDLIEQILDGLVPGMPAAQRDKIAAHSAGVPLYAVETVRALVDRGHVIARGGRHALLRPDADLEVPATLIALVAARLDRLPPAERDLVKGLAILGASFRRDAVSAVTTASEREVDETLQALVRKGVLRTVAESTSPGGEEYQFVQSILRTVATDLLSRRQRKVYHLAVATRLEEASALDVVELVAAHYNDAYQAARNDPDKDDIRARAATAYGRAADRVASLGSPERAVGYYEMAASLTTEQLEGLRLTESAARVSYLSGQYEKSAQLYEQVMAEHQAAGREVAAAKSATFLARCLSVLGRVADGMSLLRPAVEVLAANEEVAAEAEAHAILAEWFAFAMTDDEVAEHANRAYELATAANSPEVLCRALNAKGWLLQRQHHAPEAAAMFAALVEVAQFNDLPRAELMGRGNLADVRSQSDLPGAESDHLAALELTERLGDVGNRAIALSNLAFHYFYAGQWDLTESYARRAVESLTVSQLQNFGHFPLLMLAVTRGDIEAARTHLRELKSWADDDDAQSRDSYLIAEAAVALAAGPPSESLASAITAARSAYESNGLISESFRLAWPLALEAAMRCGDLDEAKTLLAMVADAPAGHLPPYLAAQQARYATLVTIESGQPATEVEAELRSAMETLRDLGYRYWLARAQVDLARWLGTQNREEEAARLLADARQTFIELDASADLRRTALSA
jgi:class 3 adenylate cyclase